jgi:nucleoside-diphosphate kinase
MTIQTSCSIIKPDAVKAGVAGKIIQRLEDEGFRIAACKKIHLTRSQAEGFYAVHRERPFFGELVEFMTSGPVFVLVLEAEDAIQRYRDLMGPTDSTKAPADTLRGLYGTDIQNNATHGSDSVENGLIETDYFFNKLERT